jgi:hypothetical protein
MAKKHHLGPQNDVGNLGPKNCRRKISKMENHVESMEDVGGH